MPNRILREGFLSSEAINRLSQAAQLFYVRLMLVVDDYGRCEAHPAILRAKCFPLNIESVSEKQILSWLTECCQAAGSCQQLSAECPRDDGHDVGQKLITIYSANGKNYLQINKFGQRTRSASKCPSPVSDNCPRDDGHDVGQLADKPRSIARLDGGVVGCVVEGVVGKASDPFERWRTDEAYGRLKAAYESTGAAPGGEPLTDMDWGEAYPVWGRLSFEQKLAAIRGIEARRDAGKEAQYFQKPSKYLRRPEAFALPEAPTKKSEPEYKSPYRTVSTVGQY